MEVKLTPEMFEVKTWTSNNVGYTWDEMKSYSGSRLCSIDPIPFEGRVYVPIQNGYRFCIAQFDSEQKNLGLSTYYNWINAPQMCPLDHRTKYIGLCFGDTGDVSKITKILGGGVIMSNYPTLPIITDETGFTYSEGMNLLVNTSRYTESTPFTTIGSAADRYMYEFDGKKIYGVSPCKKGQKITLQAKSNLPWSAKHQGAVGTAGFWLYWGTKANAMAGQYMYAQFVPGDTTTVFNKTIPVPDNAQLANLSELYFCFRFNTYSDGTTEVTGKFWDLMVEYGDKKHNYRPNPADLVGGGGTNGYCS